MNKKHFIPLYIALIVIVMAGCSSSSAKEGTENGSKSSSGFSITDFAEREIKFSQPPERIVTLSSGAMDIIYALDEEVVGRPDTDDGLPSGAEEVEQVGNTHGIDLERLASVQPDVVLGDTQMNSKDINSVQSLGAEMVLTKADSIQDIQAQVTLYGDMLQKKSEATAINKQIDDKLAELEASQDDPVRVLLVYGAPGTYMTALPNSLSGNLLEAVGGENIASDFESLEAYPQYAQLNTERIIEANPQHILLMSHGDSDTLEEGFLKEMEKNPAWNSLEAVKAGNIEVLPADLFGTNPGTRVLEALDVMEGLFSGE